MHCLLVAAFTDEVPSATAAIKVANLMYFVILMSHIDIFKNRK